MPRLTHSAMFLSAMRSLCAGRKPAPTVPVESIDLQDAHWTGTGACAYFTDLENGVRYRVSVEPLQ